MELKSVKTRMIDIGLDVPGFIHPDITISEVIFLAEKDPRQYFERMDDIFVATVYPLEHQAIWDNVDRSREDLMSRDFTQQAFNFVMSATFGWAEKTALSLYSLASNGILKVSEPEGKVVPFVRH